MSLLRTLDRTSAVSTPSHPHPRPLRAFLCPVLYRKERPCRTFSKSAVARPPRVGRSEKATEGVFIPFAATYHKARRKNVWPSNERREYKSTRPTQPTNRPIKRVQQFADEELKALVDYYGIDPETEQAERQEEDNGQLVWNVGDDHEPWPFKAPEDKSVVEKLEELLKDEETAHSDVFDTYKQLSAPGVAYLHIMTVRKLLHHMSILQRPTRVAMQRFLSLLDDMKNADIHIVRSEWTTAIYLAGRFMGTVTAEEVQSALYLWRDMEKSAGVKGGIVTMNVLFDIAVKAGKYTLAETFLREMVARKLKFHRHFRVSLIYYYGVQQNGPAVRQAYSNLVEAGDIVDTVVMNSVIAALLRAGEPAAAEQVFDRMKRLNDKKSNIVPKKLPYNNLVWRGQRRIGLYFTHKARMLNQAGDTEELKELQEMAPIAPNSHTYSLLIRHFARVTGDIDRVSSLLRDMGHAGVPVEGSIFIVIFDGFYTYGGLRYSSWTRSRMEQSWQEYLTAVRNGLDRTWVSSMAVVKALRAFGKCADGERVLRAWQEVREIWKPMDVEEENVMRVVNRLIKKRGDGVG
ncbi:hypothetical protein P280DRAFT_467708 [Massarina eburnea CBS 473.64]|uniref:Pentatricopeptide repeat protein-like protein n=1 Tax=Massarina eburnea CBS 473.64 TaxID=1395130 RepID=A0A6A6S594_9PLEO|nr:hypothetical protein P280DRAFT_467708 [Massarina eburnea CBS 473.64]